MGIFASENRVVLGVPFLEPNILEFTKYEVFFSFSDIHMWNPRFSIIKELNISTNPLGVSTDAP